MTNIKVNPNNSRIAKVRTYLFTILDTLLTDNKYQINANFLTNDVNNYSLDRLPVDDNVEQWIIPTKKYREVYELRSRNSYGQEVMENLTNIGFFEEFEEIINSNNNKGVLPDIEGIESIECLNVGALSIADTQTSIFAIQIQINYIKNKTKEITSL